MLRSIEEGDHPWWGVRTSNPKRTIRTSAGQCRKATFHRAFQGLPIGDRVGQAGLIPGDCAQRVVQHGFRPEFVDNVSF